MDNTINKYSNGKIFKIINNVNKEYYLGSTLEELNKALLYYKNYFKHWLEINNIPNITLVKRRNTDNLKLFNNMFLKYGVNNCFIILFESYPCNNIQELKERLNLYIINNTSINNILRNKNIDKVNRIKQYLIINKEKIQVQSKERNLLNKDKDNYLLNKETIKEQRRQRYLLNKDKDKDKDNYLLDKETINKQRRLKYLENKNKILIGKQIYTNNYLNTMD